MKSIGTSRTLASSSRDEIILEMPLNSKLGLKWHHLATATVKAITRPRSVTFVFTVPPIPIANGDITVVPHGITKATKSTAPLASAHFSSEWSTPVLELAVNL